MLKSIDTRVVQMPDSASVSAGILKASLRGQIRQTPLPKWKALLPLFEAVMNSFQAIQDSKDDYEHHITINVIRDFGLLPSEDAPITGFDISDTGIGFDDENFDSFNTAYSEHKVGRGGKGLGRFMWLKAFEKVGISSVFRSRDSDGVSFWKREFSFDVSYDPDLGNAIQIEQRRTGSTISLQNFRAPYKEQCPTDVGKLAQRLAEHFILVLMQPDCPVVEIHDQGHRISLNSVFQENFKRKSHSTSFSLQGKKFTVIGFRLSAPGVSKHRLTYAANSRGVVTETLEKFIPNLIGRLIDGNDESFVYLAVVEGEYLNDKVNNYRTSFEIREDIGDELELELDEPDIRISQLRDECISFIEKDLAQLIDDLNKSKRIKIVEYVGKHAPQYRPLLKYIGTFIDRISPNASNIDIELALHRELHNREVALKRESRNILNQAAKQENYDDYKQQFSDFMEKSNELGVSALAQYVMHRKIVLELFEKALKADKRTDKYPLEAAVHNILFPMRATNEEILYSQQNLWLIDERLTYHSFIASDKPLDGLEAFDSSSKKRPDLFIFDRKIAFSERAEDGNPINSIAVVEFKRPQRKDYSDESNPLMQVVEQIGDIRSGQFLDEDRRPIPVANSEIPAFAYVICDITEKLKKVLLNWDLTSTPDGQMFFGYHRNYGIYCEVIDYRKLLSDSKKRNRIFFDKLNIMGGIDGVLG